MSDTHVMPHHGFARSIAKPALRSATSGIPVLPVSRRRDMVGHGGTPVHLVFGETQALNSDHQPQMMDIGYRLDSNCSITAPPSCLSLSQGDASPAGTNDLGYPLGIEHGWEVSYGIFEGKYGE
jgi:hypothetical protein